MSRSTGSGLYRSAASCRARLAAVASTPRVSRRGARARPRARVNLDTRGLVKIVAQRLTGRVLGIHVLAENAGDVILAGVYAVKFGLTVDDLADTWARISPCRKV